MQDAHGAFRPCGRRGGSRSADCMANSEALTAPWLPSIFPSMHSLAESLAQAEGKALEFKRDLSSPEKVMRTVVAFANGAGGTLLLGVEDGSRRVRGVADPTLPGGTSRRFSTRAISPANPWPRSKKPSSS